MKGYCMYRINENVSFFKEKVIEETKNKIDISQTIDPNSVNGCNKSNTIKRALDIKIEQSHRLWPVELLNH